MTRQEAVIKIVKITRIIGELKYQLDADDEVELRRSTPNGNISPNGRRRYAGTWNWTLPRRWPV